MLCNVEITVVVVVAVVVVVVVAAALKDSARTCSATATAQETLRDEQTSESQSSDSKPYIRKGARFPSLRAALGAMAAWRRKMALSFRRFWAVVYEARSVEKLELSAWLFRVSHIDFKMDLPRLNNEKDGFCILLLRTSC